MKTVMMVLLSFTLLTITPFSPVLAIEVAPRITDREIIESLAEIKATQKANQKTIDARFKSFEAKFDARFKSFEAKFDARFETIEAKFDGKFEAIDSKFDTIDTKFDAVYQRFESIDQRFDALETRMSEQHSTMLALFGAMISLIVALFAYIAWDRRTMFQPLQEKLDRIEKDLEYDLQINHHQGSLLTRLVEALREISQTDPKVAKILRSFSLL